MTPIRLIITKRRVCAADDFDLQRQLQRDAQAAGGYRPHCRRLRQAEEGRSAEFLRPLSVSCREDAFVLRARHAPVLSLLRLRSIGRCLHLHPEGRKHHLPGSYATDRAEAGRADAKAELLQSGRGARRSGAHGVARCARARYPIFSGMPAASRRRECPRISQRARTGCGDDHALSHWICAGFRICAAGCLAAGVRRGVVAREGAVFLEGRWPSAVSASTWRTLRPWS